MNRRASAAVEASEDELFDHPKSGGRSAWDDSDDGISGPIPDAVRLASEAVAMCGADAALASLVERFWRYAPDEDLVGLSPAEMVDATRTHRELAEQRLPGELKLDIAPSPDGEKTVVKIVTDDMPFLVDTVNSALIARNLDVDLLMHPLVVVRREPLGKLVEVLSDVEPVDVTVGRLPATEMVESWIHLEIDRIRDADLVDELRRDLVNALTDVRDAVEDWSKMRSKALEIADELVSTPLPVPDKDITDGVELLRWLGDDQFTFLGYREYRLAKDDDGETVIGAVMGTGLGILRADRIRPRHLGDMSARGAGRVAGEAPSHHHEGELAIDGAPQRVPRLHRHQDVRQRRQRDRREAVPRAVLVRRVPLFGRRAAGRQAQGGRGAGAVRPVPAQPFGQGPDGDPGGLPARRAVPDPDRRTVRRR